MCVKLYQFIRQHVNTLFSDLTAAALVETRTRIFGEFAFSPRNYSNLFNCEHYNMKNLVLFASHYSRHYFVNNLPKLNEHRYLGSNISDYYHIQSLGSSPSTFRSTIGASHAQPSYEYNIGPSPDVNEVYPGLYVGDAYV